MNVSSPVGTGGSLLAGKATELTAHLQLMPKLWMHGDEGLLTSTVVGSGLTLNWAQRYAWLCGITQCLGQHVYLTAAEIKSVHQNRITRRCEGHDDRVACYCNVRAAMRRCPGLSFVCCINLAWQLAGFVVEFLVLTTISANYVQLYYTLRLMSLLEQYWLQNEKWRPHRSPTGKLGLDTRSLCVEKVVDKARSMM